MSGRFCTAEATCVLSLLPLLKSAAFFTALVKCNCFCCLQDLVTVFKK